jgi:hypothetical protein
MLHYHGQGIFSTSRIPAFGRRIARPPKMGYSFGKDYSRQAVVNVAAMEDINES